MNVIKVIVDELPEGCHLRPFIDNLLGISNCTASDNRCLGGMKVIKVIVDEVPESCFECGFRVVSDDFDCLTERCSLIDGGYVDHNKRPEWCPLVTPNEYAIEIMESLGK